jgi:predicted ArsR family transcriptional regulator
MPSASRRLLGPAQWAALRNPRRLEVVMAMEAHAPCSIAELAAVLACRPASLYRHLQVLERAGLLKKAGRKPAGRRWATVYAHGPWLSAGHYHAPSGRGLREHGELVVALARPAARTYLRGVMAQRGRSQKLATTQASSMFERTWLDASSQREVKRLFLRLVEIVRAGRRSRRGQRFQISVMSAPIPD